MIIQVCVGSSCHLRGSEDIVLLMQKALEMEGLENEVVLMGSFCIGKCSPSGVTVQVDDDVHVGVTREGFKEFFAEHIIKKLERERG